MVRMNTRTTRRATTVPPPRRRLTAPRRRIQDVSSGTTIRDNRGIIPAQPRASFVRTYARPRIGMPDTSSQLIRKSYSIFTKNTEYDKQKALDFFSAIKQNKFALPMPNSLGTFQTASFSRRQSVTSNISGNFVYIAYQFTPSQVTGLVWTQTPTPSAVATGSVIFFPDMNSTPPQNMRNSRATLTLLNTTASTSVAGSVSSLYVNNGLDWDFSASTSAVELSVAFQNEINTMIETNTKSKIHGAANFIGDKMNQQFSLIPSSMANLEEWAQYVDGLFDATTTKNALINGARNFSHSTLLLRIEPTAVANTYSILINNQFALRYPSNSILSSIGQHEQKYINKNLVEKHSGILNGEGHSGGGTGWNIEPSYQIITDKQQYKYTVDEGLKRAYNNINNHFYDYENKVLYLAGTKWKDLQGNITIEDALTDATIALNAVEFTPRYRQAEQLYKLYKPDMVVGHSLSGFLSQKLNEKYGVPYRSYGGPFFSLGSQKFEHRRHIGDPISIFDRKARIVGGIMDNPHTYQGYRNF